MQKSDQEDHLLLLLVVLDGRDGLIGCNSRLIKRHRQDVVMEMVLALLDMVMLI